MSIDTCILCTIAHTHAFSMKEKTTCTRDTISKLVEWNRERERERKNSSKNGMLRVFVNNVYKTYANFIHISYEGIGTIDNSQEIWIPNNERCYDFSAFHFWLNALTKHSMLNALSLKIRKKKQKKNKKKQNLRIL